MDEYRALVAALAAEHAPQGATEEHLVEELAGIIWRKRRLRLAEAAAYRRELRGTLSPYGDTVKAALAHLGVTEPSERVADIIGATESDMAEDLADLEEDEAMTRRALDLLNSSRTDAYEEALAALREDTQHWWEEVLARAPDDLEDGQPYTPDAAGLRRFLQGTVLRLVTRHRRKLANQALVREQALGEALEPDRLEQLRRYEVHLDRKLERTLAMLLRLQDLRRAAAND